MILINSNNYNYKDGVYSTCLMKYGLYVYVRLLYNNNIIYQTFPKFILYTSA